MIYLDNAATTFPKPEKVYSAMDLANRTMAVNAGRGSYKLALEASTLITETKSMLRNLVSADCYSPVVFAPSATIAMNQVIYGIDIPQNAIVYISPYEHNAVARTVYSLSKSKGTKIKLLPVNMETLDIDLDMMKYEFSKEKPAMVICTHVSNVTGYILPVKDIFREAKKYDCITVLDSAQSLGLVEIDSRNFNVDVVVFAGHKTLYGPFGIGGFINVNKIELSEFLTGGTGSDSLNLEMPRDMETKFEPASSNIVAISGLNAALKCLDIDHNYDYEKELTEYAIDQLSSISEVQLYVPKSIDQRVGVISFNIEDMTAEDVGIILDEDFDIAVRTGYHCAPHIHSYLNNKKSLGTVRIGISQFNEKKDIDNLVNAIQEIVTV